MEKNQSHLKNSCGLTSLLKLSMNDFRINFHVNNGNTGKGQQNQGFEVSGNMDWEILRSAN